jgi:hypothetical protein
MKVTALIAAYNEADIIDQVVGDLIRQDVSVYLIDNGSTDGTADSVGRWLNHGLIGVERFPADGENPVFDWTALLKRKEELARQLDADWFIHSDADEFRESPWPDEPLAQAIAAVDRAGYNAIDFEVLNFWPTHDRFQPGDDVREAFPFFAHSEREWADQQIKCWKRNTQVDLVSSGGHEAKFDGRRVFPLRFILRHYPIRGQAHGDRKVFVERKPRFAPEERAKKWHIQYDGFEPGARFLRDQKELERWDPTRVRLELALRYRRVDELSRAVADADGERGRMRAAHAGELSWLRQENERELTLLRDEQSAERARLRSGYEQDLSAQRAAHASELSGLRRGNEDDLAAQRAAHASELSELRQLHTEELARLRGERDRELALRIAQLDDERRMLTAELTASRAELVLARDQLRSTTEDAREAIVAAERAEEQVRLGRDQALEDERKRLRAKLEDSWAERNDTVTRLEGELAKFQSRLDDLGRDRAGVQADLARLEQELASARHDVAELSRELNLVYGSKSWRYASLGRAAWRLLGQK